MPTAYDSLSSSIPTHFKSLDKFRTYLTSSKIKNQHSAKLIPYELPREDIERKSLKLSVCHDYKGGYSESNSTRGYTFNWFSHTDTFIYFSHHRITIPPMNWIRSSHRQGTKILGTLIFENNSDPLSTDSILSLILGDQLQSCHHDIKSLTRLFDTGLADGLVDLAVERGFEGYLINVEVFLGIMEEGKVVGGRECAEVLRDWLAYLTRETERRIVGGEIMWYDGVTIEGLSNQWQNRLSPSNLPFFENSSSIFLNYFWGMDHLKDTINRVDNSIRSRSEVAVGLDVWGRNQFGGGGFDCWRAIDLVVEASEKKPLVPSLPSTISSITSNISDNNPTPSLSLALFAPGWSVESENLGHNLTTREGYKKWWEDESYLWNGGEETSNAKKEQIRKEKERKEERGINRARDLARILSNGINRVPHIQPFDYNSKLPSIKGTFKSISSYYPSPRAPPSPYSTFYTNFSNGAGHDFFFEGKKVFSTEKGWTDVDFSFSPPSLFYFSPVIGVEIELNEDDAWIGNVSLAIRATLVEGRNSVQIPLCPTSLSISPGSVGAIYKAVIVWKPAVLADVTVGFYFGEDNRIINNETTTLKLESGWYSTSTSISTPLSHPTSIPIPSFGIILSPTSSSSTLQSQLTSILIGSLSISPAYNIYLPQPYISTTSFQFNELTNYLSWNSTHLSPNSNSNSISLSLSLALNGIMIQPRLVDWPEFQFYILFERNLTTSNGERGKFIGTTSNTEIYLREFEEGEVEIIGVKRDGEIGESSRNDGKEE